MTAHCQELTGHVRIMISRGLVKLLKKIIRFLKNDSINSCVFPFSPRKSRLVMDFVTSQIQNYVIMKVTGGY